MGKKENTKRIAQNTLMLYFRQILIMLISLYTVRVVLNVLGAEDYGIYNVVAGVVILFSFVNNAMASATQRYLNFYLGRNDVSSVQCVYSYSIKIHFYIVCVFLFFAETVGLWFSLTKLNIPEQRQAVVFFVYQTAIISTVFKIFKIPYQSVIIAQERMNVFAILSVFEVLIQLAFVIFLKYSYFDKLIVYSISVMVTSALITFLFKVYCNKKVSYAHYMKVSDRNLFHSFLSFSGWSFLGGFVNVCNTQGLNILVNHMGSVLVNAAFAIANQVSTAVYMFYSNFQTAFNPRLVKTYSNNEKESFEKMLFCTTKISFFLLLFIALPLHFNLDFVLTIWLGNVPEFTIQFIDWSLLCSLIDTLSGSLIVGMQANGKIKNYQILVSVISILILPLSYLVLLQGVEPYFIFAVKLFISVILLFFRIFYVKNKIDLKIGSFIVNVCVRVIFVGMIVFVVDFLLFKKISGIKSFLYLLITTFLSSFFLLCLILLIGLSKTERNWVVSFFKRKKEVSNGE